MEFIHAQLMGNGGSHIGAVAGQHDGACHSCAMQVGQGLGGIGLHRVSHQNRSQVLAIARHMERGAGKLSRLVFHIVQVHQLIVTNQGDLTINLGFYTMAAHFIGECDAVAVDLSAIGPQHRKRNGMVGVRLRMGGKLQKLLGGDAGVGAHLGHFEGSRGQGARLVEHHCVHLRQSLQVVRAFHQDTLTRGSAYAAEKRERHRDDKGAGA